MENVYYFNGDDPDMQKAYQRARDTFRYFWREQFWEYRRIIPGLSVACVKLPFSDGDLSQPDSEVEHMWATEIDFDGRNIHGILLNSPNHLKSVSEGDQIKVPVGAISDWMYAIDDTVYGAFSVNAMRAQMDRAELRGHDNAWGLEFGDPLTEKIVPGPNSSGGGKKGFLGKLFGGGGAKIKQDVTADLNAEHPMALNMGEKYGEQLAGDPSILQIIDERGWTQLHHNALAGNTSVVKLFLKHGADPDTLTPEGVSAEALARVLGWDELGDLLAKAGK